MPVIFTFTLLYFIKSKDKFHFARLNALSSPAHHDSAVWSWAPLSIAGSTERFQLTVLNLTSVAFTSV